MVKKVFNLLVYKRELAALQKKHSGGIKARIAELEEELAYLKGMLNPSDPSSGGPAPKPKGAKAAGAKRERRDPAELKKDADKLVKYIKENPDLKSKAILEATGVIIKKPLNVKTFIEKYAPDAKVKPKGKKAATTYSIG